MITIHTDGSFRQDDEQSYSAAGFEVRDGRTTRHRSSAYLGKYDCVTIHTAELASVVLGLQWAHNNCPEEDVRVFNDNKNGVEHIKGMKVSQKYRTLVHAAQALSNELDASIEHISREDNRAHDLAYPGIMNPERISSYRDCSTWIRQFFEPDIENPAFTLGAYASASSEKRRRLYREHPRMALIRHIQIQARQVGLELEAGDVRSMNRYFRSDQDRPEGRWGLSRSRSLTDGKVLCEFYHTDRPKALIGIVDRTLGALQSTVIADRSINETPELDNVGTYYDELSREQPNSPSAIDVRDCDYCGPDTVREWLDFIKAFALKVLKRKARQFRMWWENAPGWDVRGLYNTLV